MLYYTIGQEWVFLASVIGGMILGGLYDIILVAITLMQSGKLMRALMDWLYGIMSAVIIIAVLMFVNEGDIRIYMLLGFGFGALLYLLGIRSMFILVFHLLSRIFSKLFHWIASNKIFKILIK